ncbi:MAG: tetratricopeptide repeat protein [Promethearchaeota archaeon]
MTAEDHFVKGNEYFEQGEFEKAIEEYQKAVEIDPNFYQAWNKMGDAYNTLGNAEQALECYERSLEIKPDQPVIRDYSEKTKKKRALAGARADKTERLAESEERGPSAPPAPVHTAESLTINEDYPFDDESELVSEKAIPLKAKAVYFPRMQQGKIYPLSVLLSSEKIKLVISEEQQEKEIELAAKIGDIIEIHPICPALSISPASKRVKVVEGVHEYQFAVVPLVEGKFDIHIEFYRDIELLGRISLEYYSPKKRIWIPGVIIQKRAKQINLGKVKIGISPRLTALYSGIATGFGVATGALDQIGIDWQSELLKIFTQTVFGLIAAILIAVVVLGFIIGMKPFQIEKDAARFKPIQYELE